LYFRKAIAVYKIQLYIGTIIFKIMKKRNLLAFILLGAATVSCVDSDKDKNNLFSIDTTGMKQQYQSQETVALSVVNTKEKAIDSVVYFINDKKIGTAAGNKKLDFALNSQKFGYQNIKALVYYDGENAETTGRIELVSNVTPKELKYDIVNTYPHDKSSYTQGLEFYRDTLIEGTGQYGESKLRKTNYKTGEVYKNLDLEQRYFGEGVTILNNKIYQLTYKENTGFIYNADTMVKEKDFPFFKQTEGWGLTNDGTSLYMTDGSEKIYKLDPATLKEVDYVNVYTKGTKIKAVNELEWVNGRIYANIYQMNSIAVIDPATGSVEGVLDLTELDNKIPEPKDVLNGIAYNPKTKTFFVTGKDWDKMFEIRIK
jgi:glutamine cyclotransferase